MRVYTVHENPAYADDRRTVLVKDGFCWPVLFLGLFGLLPVIIWAIYRRVWLGLGAYILGVVVLGTVQAVFAPQPAGGLLSITYVLLVAAEANDWRRRSLAARGYRETGVVIGEALDDAEQRYFTETMPSAPPSPPSPPPPAPPLSDPVSASVI